MDAEAAHPDDDAAFGGGRRSFDSNAGDFPEDDLERMRADHASE